MTSALSFLLVAFVLLCPINTLKYEKDNSSFPADTLFGLYRAGCEGLYAAVISGKIIFDCLISRPISISCCCV